MLSGRPVNVAGSAVVCSLGDKTNAGRTSVLVTRTSFGMPRGWLRFRQQQIVFVISCAEKKAGLDTGVMMLT